jgi:hypothetical protein
MRLPGNQPEEITMDYTILANLLWDVATGVSVGLLAYGAWLCVEYRFAADRVEESKLASAPAHLILN